MNIEYKMSSYLCPLTLLIIGQFKSYFKSTFLIWVQIEDVCRCSDSSLSVCAKHSIHAVKRPLPTSVSPSL